MIFNKIFILTDNRDQGYDNFILKLTELNKRNTLDLVEIGHADAKEGYYKDYIFLSGIFIIFSSNNEWIDETVKSIRKNSKTAVMPILVLSDTYENQDGISDCVIKTSSINKILKSEIEKYFYIVNDINTFTYVIEGSDIIREKLLILLRFLVSRSKKVLEPEKSQIYSFYYNYPLASALLGVNLGQEIEKLELLNKTKLLHGVIVDKIFLCPYCQSTNVRLNECCPKCNSIDIQIANAITHKKCGFIALEEDFIVEKTYTLKCPKCDFEFSSNNNECEKFEGNLCNACGNIFKKPDYTFSCSNCGKNMLRDQITIKKINKYYLTADGVKAAKSGILYNFSIRESVLKSQNNPIKKELFKEILYLENIRSIRYGTVFCLVKVDIKVLNNSEFILKEFSNILAGSLRVTDIYIQLEQSIFLILFLNCDVNESNSALNKIRSEIKSILNDKVKIEWKIISKSGGRYSGTILDAKVIPISPDKVVLKNETLNEKKRDLDKTTKNFRMERFIIKSISLKSIFNFFFFLNLIIFVFGTILFALIYYLGKKFGFISSEFQIILYIYEIINRNSLIYLNYSDNPVITTILFCFIGFLFSGVFGFLGFLLGCIINLCLKISRGMELRFLKNKPKV